MAAIPLLLVSAVPPGTYASSGDSGSSCSGLPYSGVAWPASSPFVTSVGGTRLSLTAANARKSEVVWNDLQWLSPSNGGGAGGGGFASESRRGPDQRGLGLSGDRRAVPDVAPANGLFYYLAHRHRSAFWDVLWGNNGAFATVPAHVARRGYDLASGLGVPQFAEIARLMPAAAGRR